MARDGAPERTASGALASNLGGGMHTALAEANAWTPERSLVSQGSLGLPGVSSGQGPLGTLSPALGLSGSGTDPPRVQGLGAGLEGGAPAMSEWHAALQAGRALSDPGKHAGTASSTGLAHSWHVSQEPPGVSPWAAAGVPGLSPGVPGYLGSGSTLQSALLSSSLHNPSLNAPHLNTPSLSIDPLSMASLGTPPGASAQIYPALSQGLLAASPTKGAPLVHQAVPQGVHQGHAAQALAYQSPPASAGQEQVHHGASLPGTGTGPRSNLGAPGAPGTSVLMGHNRPSLAGARTGAGARAGREAGAGSGVAGSGVAGAGVAGAGRKGGAGVGQGLRGAEEGEPSLALSLSLGGSLGRGSAQLFAGAGPALPLWGAGSEGHSARGQGGTGSEDGARGLGLGPRVGLGAHQGAHQGRQGDSSSPQGCAAQGSAGPATSTSDEMEGAPLERLGGPRPGGPPGAGGGGAGGGEGGLWSQRCSRSDGKGWVCKRMAREGYSLCEHHASGSSRQGAGRRRGKQGGDEDVA